MGDFAGAGTQYPPGHQGTQDGVADTRPECGDTVLPSELARIAYENHRGEITGAIRERRHPRTDVAAAQDETVNARGGAAAVEAYADRNAEEDQNQTNLD